MNEVQVFNQYFDGLYPVRAVCESYQNCTLRRFCALSPQQDEDRRKADEERAGKPGNNIEGPILAIDIVAPGRVEIRCTHPHEIKPKYAGIERSTNHGR